MKVVFITALYSVLTTTVDLGIAKFNSLETSFAPLHSTMLGSNQSVSSNLITWFNYSFQSNSVMWLLISSFLGGIIGASSKFIFEIILPSQLKEKKEVVVIARKYSIPILVSAEALRNRLDNMIRLHETIEENGWLSYNETPGYYYLSTLFLAGRFLGWVEILRSTVVCLDLSSVQQTRKFGRYLSSIESILSDPQLFLDLSDTSSLKGSDRDWCYSYELSAIGEIMSFRDSSNNEHRVYGFAAFKELIKNPEKLAFRDWLDCLSKLFRNLKYDEPRFKRLVAAHAILTLFINHMDPKHIRTKKRSCYWEYLNADQKAEVESRIELLENNLSALGWLESFFDFLWK